MGLIPGYEKGADITLLNTVYQGRRKLEDDSLSDDVLTIIFKDNVTGEKKHHDIVRPEYTYYKIHDDFVTDYNQLFISKDDCDEITCPYTDILKSIADNTGNTDLFYENIRNRTFRSNDRALHSVTSIMSSDMNISDYYRAKFAEEYKNDIIPLHKAFLDIETDGKYQKGSFPEPGEVPINAVTYIDQKYKKIKTFLLRNSSNPLIQQYEDKIGKDPKSYFEFVKEFICEKVGGYKKYIRYGLNQLDVEFYFFDEEINLLKALFDTINDFSPDFCTIWNAGFDMTMLIARIYALGYDAAEVICPKDFKYKCVRYFEDTNNRSQFAERSDYANIASYTVYICQMISFASRRKGRGMFPSFKLDFIGMVIAGVQKLSYEHITQYIEELPYLDYEIFVLYNIMDVIVQLCIEIRTTDMEYVFTKCLMNNTRYSKCHRQSVYLVNRFTKEFKKEGLIIGNNVNRWNAKGEKFPGAIVGDPTHNNDYAMMTINGRKSTIANNLMDFDYKALYPSITGEHNMAPNTQIGMVFMDSPVWPGENPFNNPDFNRSGDFLDHLASGNLIEVMQRYFRLAGIMDMIHDVYEYFETNMVMSNYMTRDNHIVPIGLTKGQLIEPLVFTDGGPINPLYHFGSRPGGYQDYIDILGRRAIM